MDEGAVCPIPLPQDHVQLGVMRVRIEGAELVHVKGLRVDLEGSNQDLSQPGSISTGSSIHLRTMLPKSSSRPLPATLARSRNLAHASLETAVILLILLG